MRFFEKSRPQVYLHGAKLRRDKKTGKRLWGLTLIVTMDADLVLACDSVIVSAFEYLLTLDHSAVEVNLDMVVFDTMVDCFALADDKVPNLHLAGVDLDQFRLTRDSETVEMWFHFEIENNAGLHAFVKEYAFSRFWMQFTPHQCELDLDSGKVEKLANDPAFLGACDRFTQSVRNGEVESITLSTAGMDPVVIDQAAAKRIHSKVKRE